MCIRDSIDDAYAHDYGPSDHRDEMRFARVRAEAFDVWVARDETGELIGSVTTRRPGGASLHEDVAVDELDLRLLGVSPVSYTHLDVYKRQVHDTGWREEDYGYGRIERLRELLSGAAIREVPEYNGIGGDFDSARVEPHSAGLSERLWYGGGSLRSAEWAGAAGLNWLVSNITSYEEGEADFATAQRKQIDVFRAAHTLGEMCIRDSL